MALTNYTDSTLTGSTTSGQCVSTAETTLATITLPANQATSNDGVTRVYAWGAVANNANNKTLTVYFGATSQAFVLQASTTNKWLLEVIIADKTATTQTAVAKLTMGLIVASTIDVFTLAPAEDRNGSIVIKTTGTGGATGDITQAALIVDV